MNKEDGTISVLIPLEKYKLADERALPSRFMYCFDCGFYADRDSIAVFNLIFSPKSNEPIAERLVISMKLWVEDNPFP
ncbi:hypothetical protein ACO3VM_06835 [Methanocaldococcus sp. 10A]